MGDDNDATVHDLTAPDEPTIDSPGDLLRDDDAADADASLAQIAPLGDEVMGLLAQHVPLALLADLAAPSDRDSTEILRSEGLPTDAWWETPIQTRDEPDLETAPRSADTGNEESRTA